MTWAFFMASREATFIPVMFRETLASPIIEMRRDILPRVSNQNAATKTKSSAVKAGHLSSAGYSTIETDLGSELSWLQTIAADVG